MRFNRGRPKTGGFEIVVTAMLDINFLLIMFFMMTAHFQRDTAARLDLPQERGEENPTIDEAGLVVNLNAAGEIIVSNRTVDLTELRQQVQSQIDKLNPTTEQPLKLMIRADRHAGSARMNEVVTMLREMGVGVIRIATEIPV
jgi:biopolymer transport protein ExbD